MGKIVAEYCWDCGRYTKQEIIQCNENVAMRLFFGIFTLGYSEMLPKEYECECLNCGLINTVRR